MKSVEAVRVAMQVFLVKFFLPCSQLLGLTFEVFSKLFVHIAYYLLKQCRFLLYFIDTFEGFLVVVLVGLEADEVTLFHQCGYGSGA